MSQSGPSSTDEAGPTSEEPKLCMTEIQLSPDDVKKTCDFYNFQIDKRNELGIGESGVVVAGGKVCFLDQTNTQVRLQADGELIARITWKDRDREFGVLRRGYTIYDFRSPVAERKDSKVVWFNAAMLAGPDIVLETVIRLCAEEHKYDLTQSIRLGPEENEQYIFGLRNLTLCSMEESILAGASGQILEKLAVAVDQKASGNALPDGLNLVHVG
jgi:hypothetical protein